METKTVDIKKMSKETGISIKKIENALGTTSQLLLKELEKVTTIEGAKLVYNNAPSGSDSRTEALRKWNELSLKELEKVTTVEEALRVYYNTLSGSDSRTRSESVV